MNPEAALLPRPKHLANPYQPQLARIVRIHRMVSDNYLFQLRFADRVQRVFFHGGPLSVEPDLNLPARRFAALAAWSRAGAVAPDEERSMAFIQKKLKLEIRREGETGFDGTPHPGDDHPHTSRKRRSPRRRSKRPSAPPKPSASPAPEASMFDALCDQLRFLDVGNDQPVLCARHGDINQRNEV